MFILFGFKTAFRHLSTRSATCQYCHQFAPQDVVERANKLSVFFIPILTTSRSYAFTCSNCGGTTPLTREQKDALTR